MPYDNQKGLIASAVILELIACTCVGLRFLSRRKKRAPIIASDWMILASLICATGLTVMQIYGLAVDALGSPLNATIEDPHAVTGRLNKAKHIELSFLTLGIFTLGLIKTSVALLYWSLFDKPFHRKFSFITVWIVIIILWTVSFVIAALAECGSHLLALFSTPKAYLDHCGSAITTGWAMVGSDVATDVITLIIPIPKIWALQLPTHRKILVAGIFLIGSLSVGASIAKAYIYITASKGLYTEDAIIILTGLSVWNLIEVQVGIMAACGPTLRPILGDIVPRERLISILDSLRNQLSSGVPSKDDSAVGSSWNKMESTERLSRGKSGESAVEGPEKRTQQMELKYLGPEQM